jgi:type IV pilus assembly protein PilB
LPLHARPAVIARIKILANLKIDETRLPQDGRFSAHIIDKDIDFRVSTFPTSSGEKAVLRVLDPLMGRRSFEDMGLSGRNLTVINKAIKKPFGMILATGPTGSGKTTTLYAILNLLNKEAVNILTVEDPIEYYIEGVNQSEVKPGIGYDFARALRHMVRQDPDIMMVGEIRDEETASLAIHAALTGHVLLSTLHTNNAIGAIPRLIDIGIKPFLIPPTLNIVIAQRLIGRLCPYCKKKEPAPSEIQDLILKEIAAIPEKAREGLDIPAKIFLYKAKGCKKCNLKGFAGRIGLFEILVMTDSLAEVIRKESSEKVIRDEAERQGMVSMRQDGILKVLEGLTSIEEVLGATAEG